MSKILISFIGSHDLKKDKSDNGPLEQLIKYLKPTKTFIFLTTEYKKEFENNNLYNYYSDLLNNNLEIINTDIKNPTDSEEIVTNISAKIDEINNFIIENKFQGFVNLTSGTPAIISVLSLFIIIGQLNRTHGMYAPNPKFDNQIKTKALDFYKNSFAFKTIKDMINQMNYIAVDEFLNKNKNTFPKLKNNEEFKNIIKFARYRATCNYEKAEEIYNKYDYIQEFEYKTPTNLFEKTIELCMSAKISERNANDFQAVLKSGIIRENLKAYIVEKLLEHNSMDIIKTEVKPDGSSIQYFNENIENYPDLIDYIQETLNNSFSVNKNFDTKREINAFTYNLIFNYFIEDETNENLLLINKEFNKLEQLQKERNKIAHTINSPIYNPSWLISIEKIIKTIALEFKFEEPMLQSYQSINDKLLKILKDVLNN